MEEIFGIVVSQFPTIAGLVVLAVILYKQNEKLLDKFFTELDDIRERLTEIEKRLM